MPVPAPVPGTVRTGRKPSTACLIRSLLQGMRTSIVLFAKPGSAGFAPRPILALPTSYGPFISAFREYNIRIGSLAGLSAPAFSGHAGLPHLFVRLPVSAILTPGVLRFRMFPLQDYFPGSQNPSASVYPVALLS